MNEKRLTDRARAVMNAAASEADRLGHNYIGTEHILLGLAKENGGVSGYVLKELGVTPEMIVNAVNSILGTEE